jgi:hypothetical protein
MKIDEPAAEVRLGPRAQIILDVPEMACRRDGSKADFAWIFEYHVQPKQIGIAWRELLERTGGRNTERCHNPTRTVVPACPTSRNISNGLLDAPDLNYFSNPKKVGRRSDE